MEILTGFYLKEGAKNEGKGEVYMRTSSSETVEGGMVLTGREQALREEAVDRCLRVQTHCQMCTGT